jgi:superfamily II DNA or RNA helicase
MHEIIRTNSSLLVKPPIPSLLHAIGYLHRDFRSRENEWKTVGQIHHQTYQTLPGYFQRVVRFCQERDIPFRVSDQRKRPELMVGRIELAEQRLSGQQFVEELNPQENGLLVGPCGIGKTHVIKALLEAAPVKKILITTDDIGGAMQLHSDLEKLLPHLQIGLWCSRRKTPLQQVMVATIDSLSNLDQSRQAKASQLTLADFAMWVADEVHTLPSTRRLQTLTGIRAPLRYGLTATPQRKDGADFLLEGYFGPAQSVVGHNEGAARHEVCPVRVFLFPVPRIPSLCRLSPESQDWRITAFGLVHYTPLHHYIGRIASMLPRDGGHIIFADWIKYSQVLHKVVPNARLLHGRLPFHEIQEIKSELQSKPSSCVIATDIIQKSFNAPPVKYVTMAALGSAAEKVQRIGRATRYVEDKGAAQVHDFIHFQHPALFQASLKSVAEYLKQGWKVNLMATKETLDDLLRRHPYLGEKQRQQAQEKLLPLCSEKL